ncbi:MAG: AAA family ATPase [Candidatus Thiodiazotropha taylori]
MSGAHIQISRLVILRDNRAAYDEGFHSGINVIRGDNGTGKSTIADLIFYALGGEITDWTEHQRLCTHTLVEVRIGEAILTLRREITDTGKAPMFIFEGDIEESKSDSVSWFRYPNARSEKVHSYSQQLFELMGLPRHKTDDNKNLTMHQILRLMYVDQITSTTKLLREEVKYDGAVIRRAIGEYLLGIDDLEAHNLRQEIISANKAFESVDGELKAIYRVLGSDATVLRRQQLNNEIEQVESRLAELEIQRSSVRASKYESIDIEVKRRIKEIQSSISSKTLREAALLERKQEVSAELVDTKLFLESIKFRLRSIQQSKEVNLQLGSMTFKYCPACLSPLAESDNEHICGLCKSELPKEKVDYAYVQMINELNFQSRESTDLITSFSELLASMNTELPEISREIAQLKWEYAELSSNADSVDAVLSEISAEIGFMKGQLTNLREKLDFVGQVEALIEEKARANAWLTELKEELTAVEESTAERYQQVYSAIEEIATVLLVSDGGYEGAFDDPQEVAFDFARDTLSVNGRKKFSASSMVVMKNSIRAAMFSQSIGDEKSRFPGLFLMDNIEDKGMTTERSQNYQRSLLNHFSQYETCSFQLILTTSMVADELNTSDFAVGDFYAKGMHTLLLG